MQDGSAFGKVRVHRRAASGIYLANGIVATPSRHRQCLSITFWATPLSGGPHLRTGMWIVSLVNVVGTPSTVIRQRALSE